MDEDALLLRRFALTGDQDAFADLTRRKVQLVYAAALRQVGGDEHLAKDVTQAVFFALASQARKLEHHQQLSGWLYTTTRFLALKALRTQSRWQSREQHASTMIAQETVEPKWDDLRDVIDESMHEIGDTDRAALVMRFFEGKALAEVGTALGLSENAARMRVDRALEKLRDRLKRRGVVSAAAALGATLSAQPIVTVPSVLLMQLSGAGWAAVAASSQVGVTVSTVGSFMAAKGTTVAVTALAALGIGLFVGIELPAWRAPSLTASAASDQHSMSEFETLRAENARLRRELASATSASMNSGAPAATTSNAAATKQEGQTPPLEALRVLLDLQQRRLLQPQIRMTNYGTTDLSKSFVTLFNLTDVETETLQRTVNTARDKLATLEKENAFVQEMADGSLVINMKAYPEAGGAVYDEMMKSFSTTLGAERQKAFLALASRDLERSLGYVGAADRTLTITPLENGTKFDVREDHKTTTESGSSASTLDGLVKLKTWAGSAASLIPPSFGKPK
jgi:RNA polymerase sigma factor (sigma-70 family)